MALNRKLCEVYLRIYPGNFHYLKFILEGYDNLAVLSSYDNRRGVVVIRFAEKSARDLFSLLSVIAHKLAVSD